MTFIFILPFSVATIGFLRFSPLLGSLSLTLRLRCQLLPLLTCRLLPLLLDCRTSLRRLRAWGNRSALLVRHRTL